MKINAPPPSADEKLPFDIHTVFAGLRRRRLGLLILLPLALFLGLAGALLLGHPVYDAKTVVLYQPAPTEHQQDNDSVATMQNSVLVDTNVAETIKRLHLSCTVSSLQQQCEVSVQKNTALMEIHANWSDPRVAADIANTLRDVFIADERRLLLNALTMRIKDLEQRVADVTRQVDEADGGMRQFLDQHGLTNPQADSQFQTEALKSLDAGLEQARLERQAADLQIRTAQEMEQKLQQQVASERAARIQAPDASMNAARIDLLRHSIADDRERRVNQTLLAASQKDVTRYEGMYKNGLVSQAELERVENEHKRLLALTLETPQMTSLQQHVTQLENAPPAVAALDESTPSASLEAVRGRSLQATIDRMGAEDKIHSLEVRRARLAASLQALPQLQLQYQQVHRGVDEKETELKSLQAMLSECIRLRDSHSDEFVVMAPAEAPPAPSRSHRKLMGAICAAGTLGLGFAATLGSVLLDDTIRSAPEVPLKVGLSVLGIIPLLKRRRDGSGMDYMGILARQLRCAVPGAGSRIVLTSTEPGEGKTTLMMQLARSLAVQGESVLMIDGNVNSGASLQEMMPEGSLGQPGLSDFIEGRVTHVADLIVQTVASGVWLIGRGTGPVALTASTLKSLFTGLPTSFSIVLVDAPSAGERVDADLIATHCDAVVYVIRSGGPSVRDIRRVVERVARTGIPMPGAILNAVPDEYAALS